MDAETRRRERESDSDREIADRLLAAAWRQGELSDTDFKLACLMSAPAFEGAQTGDERIDRWNGKPPRSADELGDWFAEVVEVSPLAALQLALATCGEAGLDPDVATVVKGCCVGSSCSLDELDRRGNALFNDGFHFSAGLVFFCAWVLGLRAGVELEWTGGFPISGAADRIGVERVWAIARNIACQRCFYTSLAPQGSRSHEEEPGEQ